MEFDAESLNMWLDFFKKSKIIDYFNDYKLMILISILSNIIVILAINYAICILYNNGFVLKKHIKLALLWGIINEASIGIALWLNYSFSIPFKVQDIFSIYPPYYIIIIYFSIIKILGLSKSDAILIALKTYLLLMFSITTYFVIQGFCFYYISNNLEYRPAVYQIGVLLSMCWICTISLLFAFFAKKYEFWRNVKHKDMDIQTSSRLRKHILYAIANYAVVISTMKIINLSHNFMLVEICIWLLSIECLAWVYSGYLYDKIFIYTSNYEKKHIHMQSIVNSIDEFHSVRQDLSNMMQVYDGYMSVEDYEGLRQFHKKIFATTRLVGDSLDISTKLNENPALYSVLLAKMDLALKQGINISTYCQADASNIDMGSMKLSRIMGILLDNAIEATVLTEKKTVFFATENKDNHTILISISNPTPEHVNVNKIIMNGYSTKQNHNGIGLYEVWQIMSREVGTNLSIDYDNYIITFYVELPCKIER